MSGNEESRSVLEVQVHLIMLSDPYVQLDYFVFTKLVINVISALGASIYEEPVSKTSTIAFIPLILDDIIPKLHNYGLLVNLAHLYYSIPLLGLPKSTQELSVVVPK